MRRPVPFKSRLYLMLVFFAVVPVVLALLLSVSFLETLFSEQAVARLEVLSRLKQQEIHDWIIQGSRALELLIKKLPTLYHGSRDEVFLSLIQKEFSFVTDVFPLIKSISLADREDNQIYCSSDSILLNRRIRPDEYLIEYKRGIRISSVIYSVSREQPVLKMLAEADDQGRPLPCYLNVELDLADLQELINYIPVNISADRAFLIGSYGFYATLPPDLEGAPLRSIARGEAIDRALNRESGNMIYKNDHGIEMLCAYSWLPEYRMALIVEMNYSLLADRMTGVIWIALLVGFVFTGVAILAGYFTIGFLMKPLDLVIETALAIKDGDLSERVMIEDGGDVSGRIARVFNDMADSVQNAYNSLEQKVAERTSQLTLVNLHLKREIEERKNVEEKLVLAKEEALAARLRAEEAAEAKSQFLANMSHELRTPLNGIGGMLTLLKKTVSSEENNHLLSLLAYSTESLNQIISDLLDFSRIDKGLLEINRDKYNLREAVVYTLSILKPLAHEKGLVFYTSVGRELAWGYGDITRINQILVNLVTNAIKYTDQGRVAVEINHEKELVIRVSDTGIGIPENSLKVIFNPFKQVENTYTKQRKGLGLGLAIVKQLVELMEGKLDVDSTLGKGSLFTVTLPVPHCDPVLSQSHVEVQESKFDRHYRLLVAEDDKITQIYLTRLLAGSRWSVELAGTGEELIKYWQKNTYDLILMDIGLPIINGVDAALRIREEERYGRIPIIAMTGYVMDEDIERFLDAGIDRVLSKPFKEAELFRLLEELLGCSHLSR